MRLRGTGNLLSNILFCFVYPPYEAAMPCRQNIRNARSRALRVRNSRRNISKERDKNEKDRARRMRAKTK